MSAADGIVVERCRERRNDSPDLRTGREEYQVYRRSV